MRTGSTAREPEAAPEPGAQSRGTGRWPRLPKPETRAGRIAELLLIVALALGIALAIQAWLVKPYQIPSQSMEPTLDVGQRILVNRLDTDPEIGDLIVFNPPLPAEEQVGGLGPSRQCGVDFPDKSSCPKAAPEKAGDTFVKRVVAGPGDTVAVRNGHVVLNGKLQHEAFINLCHSAQAACSLPKPVRVPDGHYFMMGDNRGQSDDSRYWGAIPKDWVIGKMFATYWPPNRIGFGS